MKYLMTILLALLVVGGYFFYSSYRDLNYARKELNWGWYQYQPLGHGIQIARTSDTHQLILRTVDRRHHISMFVSTTLTNRFDVLFFIEQSCQPDTKYAVALTENGSTKSIVSFLCNEAGDTLSFRHAWKKLPAINLEWKGKSFAFPLDRWDVAVLKKDQFMQLHPEFFRKNGEPYPYEWSRD